MRGCEEDPMAYSYGVDWQQSLSLGIVAVTAGLFIAARIRRRRDPLKRHSPCGCAGSSQCAPKQGIIYRGRKGERPEMVIRSQ
jgi:hypothetical protein